MMKLSIIIPVFNEEKTISQMLEKINRLDVDNVIKQVIIVNDGSTDRTKNEIENFVKNHSEVKSVTHAKNQGKGAAIRTGIETATGEYVVIQDADLEYDPKDIGKIVKPILNGTSKVDYGTSLNRLPSFSREERTPQFLLHYLGNKFLSLLTSILYGQWITDMETCYKLFPRKAVENMKLNARGFEFEPEITAKLLKKGYKILEIPISTKPRGYDEGKKLNTFRDGTIALWSLLKYRFVD